MAHSRAQGVEGRGFYLNRHRANNLVPSNPIRFAAFPTNASSLIVSFMCNVWTSFTYCARGWFELDGALIRGRMMVDRGESWPHICSGVMAWLHHSACFIEVFKVWAFGTLYVLAGCSLPWSR